MFNSTRVPGANHGDLSYDVVLRNCNGKLNQWADTWEREMQRGKIFDARPIRIIKSK
jgi:hypothetical protein